MDYAAIAETWPEAWKTRFNTAVAELAPTVRGSIKETEARCKAFAALLQEIAEHLTAINQMNQGLPAELTKVINGYVATIEQRLLWMTGGFLRGSITIKKATPDAGYVWFIVGGVAIALVGAVFATAWYQDAKSDRDYVAYLREDLAARKQAMEQGTTLQESTAKPKGEESGWGKWLVGGLLVAGVGGTVWYAAKKS